jgi:carbamoyltransferase
MSYTVVAVNPGHNGSTALLKNGKVEFYIEEERLSRLKYDGNPFRGILEAIQKGPIDEIVIGGTSLELPVLPWTLENPYSALVRKFYPNVKVSIKGNDHHLGHAAGAYYNSGFDTAVAIVVDGAGSYHGFKSSENPDEPSPNGFETESIFHCTDVNSIAPIYKSYGNNKCMGVEFKHEDTNFVFDDAVTITKVYEAVSHYLGFGFVEAGKTMGLAPYGRYDERMQDMFINSRANKNMIIPNYPSGAFIDANRYSFFKYEEAHNEWHKNPALVLDVFKNVAWMVQNQTQKLVGDLVEKAIDTTGEKNVVLAGGYGLNCVANYYLRKRFPDINFYVDPVSHDGGTSIGLAKLAYFDYCKEKEIEPKKEKLDTLYLGIDRKFEIDQFAKFQGISEDLKYDNTDVTPDQVAELIAEGNIVSIFQSRSEAGPRALGNRSIVYDPRVKDGKDIVNKVKGREWFRPFAGSVLKEDAAEWFDLAGMEESPFMMYAVDVQPGKLGDIPAITHVDNTCRVQTVSSEQNEHYYNLIKAFKDKTGCPVLFNTSFNLAGDPLVETLFDAIATLERSELKYMYLPEIGKLFTKLERVKQEPVEDGKFEVVD